MIDLRLNVCRLLSDVFPSFTISSLGQARTADLYIISVAL